MSTELQDAIFDISLLDDYNPARGGSMAFLPMTKNASYPLIPGLWEVELKDYCLKAGTYAPGGGDGYAYAPLKGKEAEIIENVLRNSARHPEVDQENVQLLLWAIMARTRISECSPEIRKAAGALLTKKEVDRLNGGAIGKIPPKLLEAALEKLPPAAREVFEAEAKLREMFTSPITVPYSEIEKVAVRVGEFTTPPDSREIPEGRWNYDPDGFFIRLFPSGYSEIRNQILYPENFELGIDNEGRLTLIKDKTGLSIEIVYDHSIKPLLFDGDEETVALAFKELKLAWVGPDGSSNSRNLKDMGWVLWGVPASQARPAPGSHQRFAGAARCMNQRSISAGKCSSSGKNFRHSLRD